VNGKEKGVMNQKVMNIIRRIGGLVKAFFEVGYAYRPF